MCIGQELLLRRGGPDLGRAGRGRCVGWLLRPGAVRVEKEQRLELSQGSSEPEAFRPEKLVEEDDVLEAGNDW